MSRGGVEAEASCLSCGWHATGFKAVNNAEIHAKTMSHDVTLWLQRWQFFGHDAAIGLDFEPKQRQAVGGA